MPASAEEFRTPLWQRRSALAALAALAVVLIVGGAAHAELMIAGLLGAGLLVSIGIVRRRRRVPEAAGASVDDEIALRVGTEPHRAEWLDHALRSLAAVCRDRRLPLPASYAVVVDDQRVELLLAPPRPEAPRPWSADDGGKRWVLRRESTAVAGDAGSQPDAPAPYPGLVSLGRDGDRDVLVDLEAAGGPISIGGDPSAAVEVTAAVAVELATNRWSNRVRVTAAAVPDELTVFDPERLRVVEDLAEVLPDLRARRMVWTAPDVLTGRLQPAGDSVWTAEYLVSGSAPAGDLATQLAELTGSANRSPVGVLCAGEFAWARWRWSVDAAGILDMPVLGLRVRANRLSRQSIDVVAGLVAPAPTDDAPESPGGPGNPGVPGNPRVPGNPGGHTAWSPARPEIPTPPAELDVADLATAPVRVFILGPAEVQASNPIADERREPATEIVVYLALHRGGVHPAVLSASIWPRGIGASVLDAMLDRVRQWLGTDPKGFPYLRETPDGRLALSEQALLDWDVVCALLRRSRRTRRAQEEAGLLDKALRLARGTVLTERPQDRYSWIVRTRVERVAADVLVDAAHRLSTLCWDGGDHGAAGAAASAGLRVRPGEQVLWRDLLQARHALEGAAGLATVAAEMSATLKKLGVADLAPETEALLEKLAPGPTRNFASFY